METPAVADIPKSVLIIKATPKGLVALEGFLRNRSWTVNSTSNVKEALKMLMQVKPAFVLISMDHQQKKVRSLPTLLAASFPVHVFVFSESGRSGAFKSLKGNIHTLHPPLTGGSVENALLSLITKDADSQKVDSGGAAIIRGGKQEKKSWDTVNVAQASKLLSTGPEEPTEAAARGDLIWQEGAGPGPATKDFGHEENDQSPTHAHIENEGLKGVDAYMPDHAEAELQKKEMAEQEEKAEAERIRREHTIQRKGGIEDPDDEDSPEAKERKQVELNFSANKPRPSRETDDGGVAIDKKDEIAESEKTPVQADATLEHSNEEVAHKRPVGTTLTRQEREKRKDQPAPETRNATVDDIRQVLDLAFDKGDGRIHKKLEVSQVVTCLAMESEAASGYVLVAMGGDRVMDDKLIGTITRLLSDLQVKVGQNSQWAPVPILDVKFEEWARKEAMFLHKSVHQGDEVGVAFFEMPHAITKLGPSKNPEMGTLSLDDIAIDSPLAFDMRIFLTANQKFIYYLAKDAKFLKTQRERLKRLGIGEVHVSKSQFADVSAYRAQHAINGRIKDYKKNDTGSDAA